MSCEGQPMSFEARVSCRDVQTSLAAYVDGESAGFDPQTIDAHVQACPSCRRLAAAERAARELLCSRRGDLRGCAPADLRRRCAAWRATAPAASWYRRSWVPLSLAASLMLVAGVSLIFVWGSSVETYAAQLAIDHVKCFQFPPDASAATDVAVIGRTWQAANGWNVRIAASPPMEHLQLLGIRRCGSTKGRVAHILYKWRGQPLSVYVLNGKFDPDAEASHERHDYQPVTRFGENAVVWIDRGRTYAVVSRIPHPDLQQVAGYVRRTIE